MLRPSQAGVVLGLCIRLGRRFDLLDLPLSGPPHADPVLSLSVALRTVLRLGLSVAGKGAS
jgi:hypothetical protein